MTRKQSDLGEYEGNAAALREARVLLLARPSLAEELRAVIEAAGPQARSLDQPSELPELAVLWRPQIVLVDLEVADPPLLEQLIVRTREQHTCSVVLLAPALSGDTVTLADRCGADTVMVLPLDPVIFRRYLMRGLERPAGVKPKLDSPKLPPALVASSAPMREVWRLVMLAAQSDSSVILMGETGTGKEVLARALHRFSARRSGPFIAVNCAAIPENLLESELLGHEKGSFTGATGQRKGRFELAHDGTIFLDEIGELPLALQVKLLRVLQERTFERVGGTETVTVDVRVIAATHKNLEEEVVRGRFRPDLYYRLNVLSIRVPPLRERKSDILGLWQSLLTQGAAREGRTAPTTSMAVQRLLLKHAWPGNIRELYNIAQHVLTVATGDSVMPADLPGYMGGQAQRAAIEGMLVGMTLKEVERAAILETYAALGTVTAAASVLDISPRKIHYRLREYRRDGWLSGKDRKLTALSNEPSAEEAYKPRRVLLAEDDDDLRWALSDLLKSEGYDVVAVPDGRMFLEHLGSAMLLGTGGVPADVIVTDVRMPGLTGMQILEQVRARGWDIPVVVISAYADQEVRAQAERLGAAFLNKPIDFGALQKIIAGSVH